MTEYLTIENLLLLASAVISLSAVSAKILDTITDVHPSERLDSTASKLRKVAIVGRRLLGQLGVNSKADRK